MKNKVMSPQEAVQRYVQAGSHISIGGFTIVRNPLGLVHEIIRQKIRNLHVYVHSHGQAFDLLIGAGCISRNTTRKPRKKRWPQRLALKSRRVTAVKCRPRLPKKFACCVKILIPWGLSSSDKTPALKNM